MKVTIHQPEHLPWLGLLAKIAASDLWIVLDSVPYRKNYFQNRNRILTQDAPTWLTVPVVADSNTHIRDVTISADPNWKRKYLGRLDQAYPAPSQSELLAPLTETIEAATPGDPLLQLNLRLTDWLCDRFGVRTERVLASELEASGRKSELIRNLCLAAGSTEYIAGPSGRDYLDLEDFSAHGIVVHFFDFHHPTYPQGRDFVSHMAAIDALCRLPPHELGPLLRPWELNPC